MDFLYSKSFQVQVEQQISIHKLLVTTKNQEIVVNTISRPKLLTLADKGVGYNSP